MMAIDGIPLNAGYDVDEESRNRYFVESGTKTKKLNVHLQ